MVIKDNDDEERSPRGEEKEKKQGKLNDREKENKNQSKKSLKVNMKKKKQMEYRFQNKIDIIKRIRKSKMEAKSLYRSYHRCQGFSKMTKPKVGTMTCLYSGFKVLVLVLLCAVLVRGSEYPFRECDNTTSTSTTTEEPRFPYLNRFKAPGLKGTMAILNCLLARQLCFEDSSCSAILEIIPRVCGSELVACSTVTVTKCQAALRTLQAFPFFRPTCLCREPNVDPECNSFRDFLFDHPCVFVMRKEKDPYPVETLPTCTYALSVCHDSKACAIVFERFKNACKTRDNECRMDDSEACREAWAGLHLSPLFGCICPNTHMKKRCERIFAIVNRNPCIAAVFGACPPAVLSLFEPQRRLAPREPSFTRYAGPDGTILYITKNGTRLLTRAGATSLLRAALLSPRPPRPRHAKLNSDGRNSNRNGTSVGWIGGMSITQDGNYIAPDKFMTHIHRYVSPHYNTHGHHFHRWNHEPGGSEDPLYATKTVYGPGYIDENQRIGRENGKPSDDKVALQSTCHKALDACIKDTECVTSLTPVLQKCHATDCNREGCMTALRGFYRKTDVQWNTEIAFCLCKKTDNKEDSCMNAQERLHPSCAQRPPANTPIPACHSVAHACREDPECRYRLENYEQWCAVDAVTQGCAGSPANCRTAVVAVLGTQLRATCACRGTDFAQLYDCLGWQRLLWLNPCVVESQSDYHVKTYGSLLTTTPFDNGIKYITVAPESPNYHRTTTHHHRHTTQHENTQIIPPEDIEEMSPITTMSEQTVVPNEIAQISEPVVVETTTESTTTTTVSTTTTTPTTTTSTTTTTTTPKPTTTLEPTKYCVMNKPESEAEVQYIKMGETKRLYRPAELAECTDLCVCEVSLQLTCKVACVPRAPCSSRLAHYSHAAPAYQAYRGRCYCYSGSFICMRPNPGEYKLPEGVYLLLGFSAVDQELLRPHTGLGAEDAVRLLQQYLYNVHGETNCTLTLFNISNENVIISASVPPKEQEMLKESGEGLLDKEKEECIDVLKVIKTRINSQHEDISSHLLLSIFKIAEVDVVYPTPPSSAITAHLPEKYLYITIFLLTLSYNNLTIPVLFLGLIREVINALTNFLNAFNKCSLDVLRPFDERYFLNDFVSILDECNESIDDNNVHCLCGDVVVRELGALHNTHALDDAQNDHSVTVNLDLSDSVINIMKLIHNMKAVKITIFDNFNEHVADVIVSKYFSRNVYIIVGVKETLSRGLFFGNNIASSSYGIDGSVSLGLTLVVV